MIEKSGLHVPKRDQTSAEHSRFVSFVDKENDEKITLTSEKITVRV